MKHVEATRPILRDCFWFVTAGGRHLTASGRVTSPAPKQSGQRYPRRAIESWLRRELAAEVPHMESAYEKSVAGALVKREKWQPHDVDQVNEMLWGDVSTPLEVRVFKIGDQVRLVDGPAGKVGKHHTMGVTDREAARRWTVVKATAEGLWAVHDGDPVSGDGFTVHGIVEEQRLRHAGADLPFGYYAKLAIRAREAEAEVERLVALSPREMPDPSAAR
jgi:hypothetical protein